MNRVYVITKFDLKTDIPMKYALKYRDLYYNKKELISDIKYILNTINEEYQEIANTNISYSDFYNKFNPIIEVSVINLNYNHIETRKDYKNKLKELNKISKDNLEEFLLSFLVSYRFYYDKDLNIKEIYTNTEYEFYGNIYPVQFSFSYKALHPEKYHVEKYNNGDRVIYEGEEYTVFRKMNKSIFESDNPLDFLYGYSIIDDYGEILQDDKFYYYPVDEDLRLASKQIKLQKITKDRIDGLKQYIYMGCTNNTINIENITSDFYNMIYDKMIRADDDTVIILNYDSKNIILENQWSYIFFMNKNPIAYILGNIEIENYDDLKSIQIKYKNHIIDEIDLSNILKTKNGDIVLNISKYLDGPEPKIK